MPEWQLPQAGGSVLTIVKNRGFAQNRRASALSVATAKSRARVASPKSTATAGTSRGDVRTTKVLTWCPAAAARLSTLLPGPPAAPITTIFLASAIADDRRFSIPSVVLPPLPYMDRLSARCAGYRIPEIAAIGRRFKVRKKWPSNGMRDLFGCVGIAIRVLQ